MVDFEEQIAEARARKRGIELAIKRFLAGTALVGAAVVFAGFYDGDQVRVETVYTVQPGDSIWSIGEMYLPLNTGGRRYLPEFVEGIKELNPWVVEQGYTIHPGDKIRVNYWIKKETGADE